MAGTDKVLEALAKAKDEKSERFSEWKLTPPGTEFREDAWHPEDLWHRVDPTVFVSCRTAVKGRFVFAIGSGTPEIEVPNLGGARRKVEATVRAAQHAGSTAWSDIASVVQELAVLRRDFDSRLRDLERQVSEPAAMRGDAPWHRVPLAELKKHAGQTVAIHSRDGIVASGSFRDVAQHVREQGLEADVILHFVRP